MMNLSLINQFLTVLQPAFTKGYKLIRTGNCKKTLQDAFQWFLDKYADLKRGQSIVEQKRNDEAVESSG